MRISIFFITLCSFLGAFALEPFALITVPVANLREEPRHGSELLSQGIMGTPVEVRSKSGEWYAVTMPDGYEGYMIGNSLQLMTEEQFREWQDADRLVLPFGGMVQEEPSRASRAVSPLRSGSVVTFRNDGIRSDRIFVYLPDGRSGYVDTRLTIPFKPFGLTELDDELAEKLIDQGLKRVGQEYLWGGTSDKASDCSGFTRVLFQSNGIYLPRDAWQQALAGQEVDRDHLTEGDLIFFANTKGRVNHVGIYMGDGLMLHCSGMVRVDRIFNESPYPELPKYHLKPAKYRRVLTGEPLESDIKANKLYFNK